jgi:hypothetical protein
VIDVSFYKRKEFPIMLTTLLALIMIFSTYFRVKPVQDFSSTLQTWTVIIVNFSAILGTIMILRQHKNRIVRRKPGDNSWVFSVWLIALTLFYLALGIYSVESSLSATPTRNPTFSWIYNNAQVSLDSAMYSLLAFYIASASFRAFKARTKEAAVLLISAAAMMLYNAPAGSVIFGPLAPQFNSFGEWLLNVPNMAGFRGILIGAAVGAIALGIRVMTGRERGYLGAGE